MKNIFILAIIFSFGNLFADTSVFNIWPDAKMPGKTAEKYEENERQMVSSLANPTLTLYKANTKDTTGFVIVCPGGGYKILAHSHEGTDIADWLNKEKISAAILRYRVPNNPEGALQDVQRAIRFVRAHAKEWNINPDKIVVLGFSAGANLVARASTLYNEKTYEPIDGLDTTSARPDFTCLVYPAYCDNPGFIERWKGVKKDKTADFNTRYALAEELKIDANTPPTFIIQSQDDTNYINAAIAYYLALKDANVSSQLHIFGNGKHGYGLGKNIPLVKEWKNLCEDWFENIGVKIDD